MTDAELLAALDWHVDRLWAPLVPLDNRPQIALAALHAYTDCPCKLHEDRVLQASRQLNHAIRFVVGQEQRASESMLPRWNALRAIGVTLGFALVARCGTLTVEAAAGVRQQAQKSFGDALLMEQLGNWHARMDAEAEQERT